MTDAERQQMFQNTEFDLMAIKQSGNYLVAKFNKLSDRDKEDVLDYLNMKLSHESKRNVNTHEVSKKTVKDNVITLDFASRKPKRKGASV
ncbi:hypothetical protein HNQ80_000131 [Anaerosolibacter carboniphilus]|uniref:Uncharacterized protein n=1 Tax=Anaerosolibacter carboniphilus TaxID=1417629 RepID=A0A841KT25_9FIRM|nr:hypothetical protein [Anaerosolibacter carboniphilus]MBB6214062.1 hypothetical protein [Anaerosolibacter carboniphilus]